MSSLSAFCFIMIGWCGAARVRIDTEREMKVSRATQELEATINLELENNITAGPPKEDCSMIDLKKLPEDEAKPIKSAILEQVGELCQGGINKAYADYSISTGRIFAALQLRVSPRKEKHFWEGSSSYKICGFVSLKMSLASVHVDLICSHMGYGGVLLQQSEALAVKLDKPYTDLDSVAKARTFYESKGYRHCNDPCDSWRCRDVHNLQNGLYIMKKCTSSSATSKKPVQIRSTGVKAVTDITRFFVNGGSEDQKTFIANDKTYRCCCSVMNLCHLVVEGRDELPIFWRTGFSGCGAYVENSHSWNFWGTGGKCHVERESLSSTDNKALTVFWESSTRVRETPPGTASDGNENNAKAQWEWKWPWE